MRRGINAAVRYRTADPELQTIDALPSRKDVAGRPLAIRLFQTVLQANLGVGAYQRLDLVEVDDDVIALRHAYSEAGHLQRSGQQVSALGDAPDRDHCARAPRIGAHATGAA